MSRTLTPKRAVAIMLQRAPSDGVKTYAVAVLAFAERGRVLTEFHRAELLRHIKRQRPKTKTERAELARLRRFIEAAPIVAAPMSKTKH